MEHIMFVLGLAIVLGLLGLGMWALTLRAAGRPAGPVARLAAGLPAAVYAVVMGWMLLDMAGDPTAAGLWPLSVAGMLFLWMLYIGMLQRVQRLVRRTG